MDNPQTPMPVTFDTNNKMFYMFVCEYEFESLAIERECKKHRDWAILQRPPAKDSNYMVAQRQILDQNKRKRIIFSGACIETLVNSIGHALMGASSFNAIERKRFSEKVNAIFVNRPAFDMGTPGMQGWTKIISRRNALLHDKVATVNIDDWVHEYQRWQDEDIRMERKTILDGLAYLHSIDSSIENGIDLT